MYHFTEVPGFNMIRREDRRRKKTPVHSYAPVCTLMAVEAKDLKMQRKCRWKDRGSGAQTETDLGTNVGSRWKKEKVLMGNVPPCVRSAKSGWGFAFRCRILAVIAWMRFTLQPALANLMEQRRKTWCK